MSPADLALRPRGSDGWRQGLMMAMAAHGLLLVALMFSVNWRTSEPLEAIEAEMWSSIPRPAAPSVEAPPPPPAPAPPPEPAPAPEPKPAPPPPPPPEAKEEWIFDPPKSKPKPKPEPKEPPPKKAEEPKPPKPEKKPEKVDKPEKAPKPDKPAETKAQAKPTDTKPAPSAAERERARQENLKRMMAELGGSELSSAGPSANYIGRIVARIKPNIVFPDEVAGNPKATVEVRCGPDGRIISRRLIASSGVPAWDDAVLRALDRTEVLPLDERGKVPSPMTMEFRPKDF